MKLIFTKPLYVTEDTIRMAVPLKWLDEALMKEKCNCYKLLEVTEKDPSTISNVRKSSKLVHLPFILFI